MGVCVCAAKKFLETVSVYLNNCEKIFYWSCYNKRLSNYKNISTFLEKIWFLKMIRVSAFHIWRTSNTALLCCWFWISYVSWWLHKSSMYKHHFVYLPLTVPDWEASFGYSISGSQIYEDIWLRKLIKKLMMIIPKY